jgi:ABC-type multidrug transport system ATPase subunit
MTTDTPALHLAGLTKHFGAVKAVDGIDLTVGRGEVVAFLGPNGAGKTSTIDMVLGLSTADRGHRRGARPHADDASATAWSPPSCRAAAC